MAEGHVVNLQTVCVMFLRQCIGAFGIQIEIIGDEGDGRETVVNENI